MVKVLVNGVPPKVTGPPTLTTGVPLEVYDEVVAGPAGSRPEGMPADGVMAAGLVPATIWTVPLDVNVLVNGAAPEETGPPTLT